MIISLNWLKKFTEIDLPIDELVSLIGSRLVEIEEVINLGQKYKDILIVKVIESNNLEGSDHLSLTKIDDGGVTKNIERDENGLIQVVCGAPNVRVDQLVVWLPPESVVPSTFGKTESFTLGTRKLLGATSNGMIASAKELDLYDEHSGILEITDDIKPGTSFVAAYELDDYLLNIENKSLTHRPDCFSIVGFAREVAAIIGKPFHTPEWLLNLSPDYKSLQVNNVELSVAIDNPELSSRYLAIVMSGADSNKKSPFQVQTYLSRVGVRPINAVVDVTNYLMMLTGQPLHAFDYDKLVKVGGGKAEIHVRVGHEGEKLELLDGRLVELTPNDIVIASGETAIGLAGAMGGANTAIDENTKNIIIESATFNLYNLRATQMRHGIFSEAITRFTKGQPAELTAPVLFDAIRLMNEWSGASCVSNLAETYPDVQKKIELEFTARSINTILGSAYKVEDMIKTLCNVEFEVNQSNDDSITAVVPYWRADIHIVEDIAEEIGRLNGYDDIGLTLPTRNYSAVMPNDFDDFKSKIRSNLVRAGANEVLTYSFIHGNVIEKACQDVDNSYQVVNSISPDLQYYRQTLTPSLLDIIHPNIKQGFDSFAVFEINKSHSKLDGLTSEDVPVESEMVALTVTNKNIQPGASYYQAKRMINYLCDSFGLSLSYRLLGKESVELIYKPFEPKRSAVVIDKISGTIIGVVGEYKKSVTREFKLPEYTSGFEVNTKALFEIVQKLNLKYMPISRYPSSERDICLQVDESIEYGQIINAVNSTLELIKLETAVSPVDIYQAKGDKTKNITIRIKLTSHDHTLTGDEVNDVVNSMISVVSKETSATVI